MYCHVCGFRIPDGSCICPQCESDNSAYADYAPQAQPYQPAPTHAYQPTQPQGTGAYNPYQHVAPVTPAVPENSGKGSGMASFVLSIIAYFLYQNRASVRILFWSMGIAFPFVMLIPFAVAIVAMVLGVVAIKSKNVFAVVGIVVGALVIGGHFISILIESVAIELYYYL